MKILDEEIEFDFLDAEDVERLEKAIDNTKKELEKIDDRKSLSQLIRETCEIINKCFDDLFGNGISNKLFKGKYNMKLCLQAFRELVEEKERQEKEFDNEIDSFSKYLPNRKTRRKK